MMIGAPAPPGAFLSANSSLASRETQLAETRLVAHGGSQASQTVFGTLPERDRVALKLGRLIIAAMVHKEEGIR